MLRGIALVALAWIVAGQVARADDLWSYRGAFTQMGTRSEGFSGSLAFHGKPVSPKIGAVVLPMGTYQYTPSDGHTWSVAGWLRIGDASDEPRSPSAFDGNTDASVHWYQGARKAHTPTSWIYAPAQGYWIDPDHLQQFADVMLRDIPSPAPSLLGQITGIDALPAVNTGFLYRETIVAKGSKSAGLRGELSYDGKPLTQGGLLVTPIGSFHHVQASQLWQPQGWFPAKAAAVKVSATPIAADALQKGAYQGAKRFGTPSNWCYAPQLDTWFAPERLR
ncbi:MAG: hypothetical protein P4L82_08135 [Ancalomicrobiaceae bacterium]|nr:hypothetical protein [Ancalomicrobiaceae bacterium]